MSCFFIINHSHLALYYILVIAYGRSRLGIVRMELVNLPCGFIYERQHHLKRDALLLEHTGRQMVAMVHKVAGKYSRQMKVAALV